ncbi:hypothetical protein A7K93_01130 [Candidatus Methylacidiphilum fumarolicum]|nr:hypothetical protein A7K73_04790 [Candidatus Methylacidiphilum fumarolicum]TFE73736.1 hypothetical protein A7K72_05385 [Candidatus Methylacidiphilum fumarolicum]TFE75659.1 hypothetical protein A7K93_01130 [Candidatus Methylacidiphilum fumarolicum]TFE76824.1 hypothetical protein A7D33_08555 [Candidatus Methylacidiphilum fumarolicum]
MKGHGKSIFAEKVWRADRPEHQQALAKDEGKGCCRPMDSNKPPVLPPRGLTAEDRPKGDERPAQAPIQM